jgi:hypothetical protein
MIVTTSVLTFALAAISPGLAVRPVTETPRPLSPRNDSLATSAILILGLVLIAGAIRTVCRRG